MAATTTTTLPPTVVENPDAVAFTRLKLVRRLSRIERQFEVARRIFVAWSTVYFLFTVWIAISVLLLEEVPYRYTGWLDAPPPGKLFSDRPFDAFSFWPIFLIIYFIARSTGLLAGGLVWGNTFSLPWKQFLRRVLLFVVAFNFLILLVTVFLNLEFFPFIGRNSSSFPLNPANDDRYCCVFWASNEGKCDNRQDCVQAFTSSDLESNFPFQSFLYTTVFTAFLDYLYYGHAKTLIAVTRQLRVLKFNVQ